MVTEKVTRPYDIGEPIVALLREKTYTGFFLARLKKKAIWNDPIMKTAGVGYENYQMHLLYHPPFMAAQEFVDQVAVMEHEAFHIIFKHVFIIRRELAKKRPYVTHKVLGIAFDLSVNSYLTFTQGLREQSQMPEAYGFEKRRTWQFYLDRIVDRMKTVDESEDGGGENGGLGEGTPEEQKEAWAALSPDDKLTELARGLLEQSKMQAHLNDLLDQIQHHWELTRDGEELKQEEEDIMKHLVDQTIRESMEDTKRRCGKFPRGLEQELNKILKKRTLPWQAMLTNLVSTTINTLWKPAYNRRDRRFGTYPGRRRDTKANVIIAIDNSGSVSNKDFDEFWAEIAVIQNILEVDIDVIQCDTVINGHKKFRRGKKPTRTGCGGTDFRPVFNYIREKKLSPDILVFCTDGCGPAPERAPKNYLTVWVYPSDNSWIQKQDWGHHLYIKPA